MAQGLCRLFLDAPLKYRAVEVWRIPPQIWSSKSPIRQHVPGSALQDAVIKCVYASPELQCTITCVKTSTAGIDCTNMVVNMHKSLHTTVYTKFKHQYLLSQSQL